MHPSGVRITVGNDTLSPKHRRKVMRTLRKRLAATHDSTLQQKPNQGKVIECVAADRSSSHFMRTGQFTRFTDWRFIHKARLNLLPLNAARPWARSGDQRCRVCRTQPETLPHVLCHCMGDSREMTDHHKKIVKRVKNAALKRFTVTHENQPVGGTTLRPDLVLARGEEALVVDVCCPFENRRSALREARENKIRKHEPLRQYLLRRF